MMKLKFLYDNRDLARMLLENWKFDDSSLELMNQFRISANAIYPFRSNDELQFLRFSPVSEKKEKNIQAEIDFINYLIQNGYNALVPVKSKDGEELVLRDTPWGEYCATAFKSVKGKPLGRVEFTDEIAFTFGQQLGTLHDLSSGYRPAERNRWSHDRVFDWIEETLKNLANEEGALRELTVQRNYFSRLPKSAENYGLVHYDFELDNVFYDKASKSCYVIDFDDTMYHWYVMDIEQTLNSMKTELPQCNLDTIREQFIRGYRTAFSVTDDGLDKLHAFRRFANLYGYTRIKRSIEEFWLNETGWIVGLRKKLQKAADRKLERFSAPINQ
jgi:Ser/Thr protein kinase RdoA (MazF antagonist)